MIAEAETGQGEVLASDEGCGVTPDENSAEANLREFKFRTIYFDNPPINDVLCAEDVRTARLDRDGMGRVHPEIKYLIALQVLRSIATEQVGASAAVKALAAETLRVIA
jgi:hypothetical protein